VGGTVRAAHQGPPVVLQRRSDRVAAGRDLVEVDPEPRRLGRVQPAVLWVPARRKTSNVAPRNVAASWTPNAGEPPGPAAISAGGTE
jgi:hypothetical protein